MKRKTSKKNSHWHKRGTDIHSTAQILPKHLAINSSPRKIQLLSLEGNILRATQIFQNNTVSLHKPAIFLLSTRKQHALVAKDKITINHAPLNLRLIVSRLFLRGNTPSQPSHYSKQDLCSL